MLAPESPVTQLELESTGALIQRVARRWRKRGIHEQQRVPTFSMLKVLEQCGDCRDRMENTDRRSGAEGIWYLPIQRLKVLNQVCLVVGLEAMPRILAVVADIAYHNFKLLEQWSPEREISVYGKAGTLTEQ